MNNLIPSYIHLAFFETECSLALTFFEFSKCSRNTDFAPCLMVPSGKAKLSGSELIGYFKASSIIIAFAQRKPKACVSSRSTACAFGFVLGGFNPVVFFVLLIGEKKINSWIS